MADFRHNITALFVATQARIPVLLWGDPGIGKSAIVNQVAEQLGLYCETVIASIREPSDFGGIPMIVPGSSEVIFAAPRWATRLCEAEAGMLFLDEISQCPPAVQGPLMRVVLDREVGDCRLPETTAVVAAANPANIAAGGFDLAPPLANRFIHVRWESDVDGWCDGMVAGWPTYDVPRLPDDWQTRIPACKAKIAAFIRVKPSLHKQLPDNAEDAGKAYPTPRSWDMVATAMAAVEAMGLNPLGEVASVLYQGAVGPDGGLQLLTWLTQADLPNPEDMLADPKGCELPARGDRLAASLDGLCAAALLERPDAVQRYAAAWTILGRVDRKDAVLRAAAVLAANAPDGAEVPEEAAELLPTMKAAGYL